MKIRQFTFLDMGLRGSTFLMIVFPIMFSDFLLSALDNLKINFSSISFWLPWIILSVCIFINWKNKKNFQKSLGKVLYSCQASENQGTLQVIKWDLFLAIGFLGAFVFGYLILNMNWLMEWKYLLLLGMSFLVYPLRDRLTKFDKNRPIKSLNIFSDRLSLTQHFFQITFPLSELKSVLVEDKTMLIIDNQGVTHQFNLISFDSYHIQRFQKSIKEALQNNDDVVIDESVSIS